MNVIEIASDMWKEIGLRRISRSWNQATRFSKASEGNGAHGVTNSTPTTGDPDHALMIWPNHLQEFLRNSDTKIDEYLQKGKSTYDTTERAKIYKEAMEYMWTRYNLIPICFTNAVYATAANIANFECNPGNTPNLAKVTFTS